MSFQATINSSENQLLWTKAIYSLSTVSDTIKFNINADHLKISSINLSKTTLLNISFSASKFFDSYKLEKELTFLINSRQLSILFRSYKISSSSNDGHVDFFKFTINESTMRNGINRSRNKIFIQISLKNHLQKQYSLNFVRCKNNFDLKIDKIYKKLYIDQNKNDNKVGNYSDRIHYLMIESLILKNFLDMFPSTIEDFKIEILLKQRKLNLIGFNKQQLLTTSSTTIIKGKNLNTNKESQVLKQPMSLTIGVSLDDLLGDNIVDEDALALEDNNLNERLNIVYRLKDFKTFINLVNSINNSSFMGKKKNQFGFQRDGSQFFNHQQQRQQCLNFVEILLNNPGYPILFTKRCEVSDNTFNEKNISNTIDNVNEGLELFKIELILLTDSESDNMNAQQEGENITTRDSSSTANRNNGINTKDLIIPNIEILKDDNIIDNEDGDIEVSNQENINFPTFFKKPNKPNNTTSKESNEKHQNSLFVPEQDDSLPTDIHDNEFPQNSGIEINNNNNNNAVTSNFTSTSTQLKNPTLNGNKRKFQLSNILPGKNNEILSSELPLRPHEYSTRNGEGQSILWNDNNQDQVATNFIKKRTEEFKKINQQNDVFSEYTKKRKANLLNVNDRNEDINQEKEELGPTQNIYRVKGLFD